MSRKEENMNKPVHDHPRKISQEDQSPSAEPSCSAKPSASTKPSPSKELSPFAEPYPSVQLSPSSLVKLKKMVFNCLQLFLGIFLPGLSFLMLPILYMQVVRPLGEKPSKKERTTKVINKPVHDHHREISQHNQSSFAKLSRSVKSSTDAEACPPTEPNPFAEPSPSVKPSPSMILNPSMEPSTSAEPSPTLQSSTSSAKKEKKINTCIQHGNYHHYYDIRHQDSRPKHFEELLAQCLAELRQTDEKYNDSKNLYILDIGCNSGQLTKLIQDVIQQGVKVEDKLVQGFGVDIDEKLIEEAIVTHGSNDSTLEFSTVDICAVALKPATKNSIEDYLKRKSIDRFDFVSCFSVLMYIHLNHGDDGLRQVLNYLCSVAKILVLELQPWRKYRDQDRRMRRDGGGNYPFYATLGWRGEQGKLEQSISDYVIGHGFKIVCDQQKKNEFKRSIVVFARLK